MLLASVKKSPPSASVATISIPVAIRGLMPLFFNIPLPPANPAALYNGRTGQAKP